MTKRTLTKWRKEALEAEYRLTKNTIDGGEENKLEWAQRILRMTQILLDQELMKGK